MPDPFSSFNWDTFTRVSDSVAGIFKAKSDADTERIRARADARLQEAALRTGQAAPLGGFNLAGLAPLVAVAVVGSFLLKMIGRR